MRAGNFSYISWLFLSWQELFGHSSVSGQLHGFLILLEELTLISNLFFYKVFLAWNFKTGENTSSYAILTPGSQPCVIEFLMAPQVFPKTALYADRPHLKFFGLQGKCCHFIRRTAWEMKVPKLSCAGCSVLYKISHLFESNGIDEITFVAWRVFALFCFASVLHK